MGKVSAGDVGGPQVIPIGQTRDTTRRRYPTLLDAISQIQQFYFIERKGEEVSDEFLTIQGKLNFMHVGAVSGFVEGLVFAVLTAIVLPILSDPKYMVAIAEYFPLARSRLFLWSLNCYPIIVTGGLCCFVARYRVGLLSKKAVDHLLFGRVVSLIGKGILIFMGLIFLAQVITPERAWAAAKWLTLGRQSWAVAIYRITMNTKPHLINMAYETVAIFVIAILLPFISVWGFALLRRLKRIRDQRKWDGV